MRPGRLPLMVAAALLSTALGWQGMRALDASLLETRIDRQEREVADLRAAFAARLVDDAALVGRLERGAVEASVADAPTAPGIDVIEAEVPVFVDGYADEWRTLPGAPTGLEGGASLRAATRGARLFLFVEVRDDDPVAHRPPRRYVDAGEGEGPDAATSLSNGDAIALYLALPGGGSRHLLFNLAAPGALAAIRASRSPEGPAGERVDGVDAALEPTPDGYALEVALDRPPPGTRLGVRVIDVDGSPLRRVDSVAHRAGSLAGLALLPIYESSAGARAFLAARVSPGHRARLFDAAGRPLANVDRLNEGADEASSDGTNGGRFDGPWDALLFRVFAWRVAEDLPLPERAVPVAEPLRLDPARIAARAARPPPHAATTRYVTASLDRVLGTLEPAGLGGASGWLLFESNEEHSSAWAGSRLARPAGLLVLASLLATGLLLGRGLVPTLALARRSWTTSAGRANGGARRPDATSRAPPESDRLERELERAAFEEVDLDALVDDYLERLAPVHPRARFSRVATDRGHGVRRVAPALLVRALDRLVDDAVGHGPDGDIRLLLTAGEERLLAVARRGEPLGAWSRARLFDPVTGRRERDDGIHLGLGLHLVRLIAERHGGRAVAFDRPPWIVVGLTLPAAPRA